MAVPQLKQVPQDSDLETLALALNKLIQELEWLFGGAIDFKNIKAQGIVTDNLKAGAVTAEKISVKKLSAITADMGTITAGEIIGGIIRANVLLDVLTNARIGNILYLKETDASGQKGIVFSTVSGKSGSINMLSGDMSIDVSGFVTVNTGSSQGLMVNGDKVMTQSQYTSLSNWLSNHESRIRALESVPPIIGPPAP